MDRFVKRGTRAAIASEARSLEWLADAAGAATVPLLEVTPTWLATERLRTGPATPAAAERFGRALAHTHAAGADWFGQGPPGLAAADSRLADLPHPLLPAPDGEQPARSWGEFYVTFRVEPYVRIAVDGGHLGGTALRATRAALERVAAGDFDAPLPALCSRAGRLHGDLWGGNVLWTAEHPDHLGILTGVLIDPAAHGGHPETDLAELALFGSPHLDRLRAAYGEVSALADGWQERVPLHQLHMLAVHSAKFGGGYGEALGTAASRYQ